VAERLRKRNDITTSSSWFVCSIADVELVCSVSRLVHNSHLGVIAAGL
jgi:hypothetical protein